MEEKIPNILTIKNKELFRRRLLIASRILSFLLILGIFFIGFVQIKYAKEVNQIKSQYGSNGYCYMCGKETGKKCSCSYFPDVLLRTNQIEIKNYLESIAEMNTLPCENLNKDFIEELNFD